MSQSRLCHDWDRTAALLLMLYNANRDPKRSRELSETDFNPYRKKSDTGVSVNREEALELLRAVAGSATVSTT